MFWPLVSLAGFALATVLVIVLARSCTARWEQEAREARRRRLSRRQASLSRAGLVAAASVRRRSRLHRRPAGRR